LRDTPKAPFLQEIGNTDFNQVVCGIQAPPEVRWMCLPTSLKTYPPKQVAISQNGAFPDYCRWVWYYLINNKHLRRCGGARYAADPLEAEVAKAPPTEIAPAIGQIT
jgi:hypothetical protein